MPGESKNLILFLSWYISFNQPPNKISIDARIRALYCIARIYELEEYKNRKDEAANYQKRLQSVLYQREFETLGLNSSGEQFEKSDKHSLARSIWLTNRSEKVVKYL